MPEKKYLVTLTPDERDHLNGLLRKGKAAALVLTRARILLKADQADGGPGWDESGRPGGPSSASRGSACRSRAEPCRRRERRTR